MLRSSYEGLLEQLISVSEQLVSFPKQSYVAVISLPEQL